MKMNPKQLRLERDEAERKRAEGEPAPQEAEVRGPGRFTTHYIEEIINRSIQRGEFDNLPGKGKPLDMRDEPDPYDTSGNWMVTHILKNANIAPEWIELDKQIRAELEWLRLHPLTHPERRSRVIELNQKILQFNVVRPSSIPTKPRYHEEPTTR